MDPNNKKRNIGKANISFNEKLFAIQYAKKLDGVVIDGRPVRFRMDFREKEDIEIKKLSHRPDDSEEYMDWTVVRWSNYR